MPDVDPDIGHGLTVVRSKIECAGATYPHSVFLDFLPKEEGFSVKSRGKGPAVSLGTKTQLLRDASEGLLALTQTCQRQGKRRRQAAPMEVKN